MKKGKGTNNKGNIQGMDARQNNALDIVLESRNNKSAPQATNLSDFVDWAEARTRKSSEAMQLVGTDPQHALGLLTLLQHYPFIVYQGFLLWRKNMLLMGFVDVDKWNDRKNAMPPLFLPSNQDGAHSFSSVEVAGHWGLSGNLKAFAKIPSTNGERDFSARLSSTFLSHRKPLTLKNVRSDSSDSAIVVGSFLAWAARNNQTDVVIIMMRQLQLAQADDWPAKVGIACSLVVRASSRGHTSFLKWVLKEEMEQRRNNVDEDIKAAIHWTVTLNFPEARDFLRTLCASKTEDGEKTKDGKKDEVEG